MAGHRWVKTAASALAVTMGGHAAVTFAQSGAQAEIADVLLTDIRPEVVIEEYIHRVLGELRNADRTNDGLDRQDIQLVRLQQAAQARASGFFGVMQYDLDGNLMVTRDEIHQAASGDRTQRDQQAQTILQRFDRNSDGIVSLAEISATVEPSDKAVKLEALLAIDPNRDAILTAGELRELAEKSFQIVDADKDGRVSANEYQRIAAKVQEARVVETALRCDLPPVPAGSQLIVFGAYESDAISSVVLGGQEQETNLMDVVIEEGAPALYLVLTSHESMIWRLSGNTDRVTQVVVASQHAAAAETVVPPIRRSTGSIAPRPRPNHGVSASGVIGVPRPKVTIAELGCPRAFHDSRDMQARMSLAPIRRALGKMPDSVFGAYSARQVALPSGRITESERDAAPLPAGFDSSTWRDATRFWPGGLVTVDPRHVVAAVSAEPYKVLPSQMGLSQLIGAGALERTAAGAFRLIKPIAHMPPSMGGAHSVTIIVAEGVPLPPGNPVHSCVIIEGEGFAPSSGSHCR